MATKVDLKPGMKVILSMNGSTQRWTSSMKEFNGKIVTLERHDGEAWLVEENNWIWDKSSILLVRKEEHVSINETPDTLNVREVI